MIPEATLHGSGVRRVAASWRFWFRSNPAQAVISTAVGLALGAAVPTGCAESKRAASVGRVAVLDCAKQDLPALASTLARWGIESATAGKVDWAALEQDAKTLGLGTGTCAYAQILAAYRKKPTVQALALEAPDDGSAGLERLRAALGGGEIRLASGAVL